MNLQIPDEQRTQVGWVLLRGHERIAELVRLLGAIERRDVELARADAVETLLDFFADLPGGDAVLTAYAVVITESKATRRDRLNARRG